MQGVTNTFYSLQKREKGENDGVTFMKEEKTPNEFLFQVESKSK
jgi:hypothetical protein